MKATLTRLAGVIELDGTAEEIASAIKALEREFQFTQPIFIPSMWQVSPCQHEYPEGPWLSILPPPCKKCGAATATMTTITCSTETAA